MDESNSPGKTVNELVEEWGITRQTVMNRLESVCPDHSKWVKQGNKYYITPEQEKLIIERYGVQTDRKKTVNEDVNSVSESDSDYSKIISNLPADLQEKLKHIAELESTIEQLKESFDSAISSKEMQISEVQSKRIEDLEKANEELREDKRRYEEEIKAKNKQIESISERLKEAHGNLLVEQQKSLNILEKLEAPKEQETEAQSIEFEHVEEDDGFVRREEEKETKGFWQKVKEFFA